MATRTTTLFGIDTVRAYLGLQAVVRAITTLTSVGAVATAVIPAHGFTTGDAVAVAGATPGAYNGVYAVTVVDENTVTYAFAGTAGAPATGAALTASGPDRSDDVRITTIADGVSERIERETSRFFVIRPTLTDTWRGDGQRVHYLYRRPVLSVASLTRDAVLVDPSQYVVDGYLGTIRGLTCYDYWATFVATFSAGFDAQGGPALPADIVQAGLDYCKFVYERTGANALASSTIRTGSSEITIIPSPPKDILQVLKTWRDMAA